METETMGKVVVKAKLENLNDLLKVKEGSLSAEKVRALEVDAVVDTGARMLSLPRRVIQHLGLDQFATRLAQTAAGNVPCDLYRAVWLTVQERQCTVDVAAVPDSCTPLIGYIPLELMDFVVDSVGQRLIGNPEHGGENIIELL